MDSTITIYSTPITIYNTLPSISGIRDYTVAVLDTTYSGVPETRFFSFLMHLCDMQVNCILMENAKCAQSNKTCRQSEMWYLSDKIRVKTSVIRSPNGKKSICFCLQTQCILLIINMFEAFPLEQKCYRLLPRMPNQERGRKLSTII